MNVEVAVVSALHPGAFEVSAKSLGLPAPSCAVSALGHIPKRPIMVGIYCLGQYIFLSVSPVPFMSMAYTACEHVSETFCPVIIDTCTGM